MRLISIVLLMVLVSALTAWSQDCEVATNDGSWSLRNNMLIANSEFGAAQVDGLFYVAGGFLRGISLLIFNPKKDQWTAGPDLPVGTHHAAVVSVSGKVYVIGGEGVVAGNLVQIFDPRNQTWSRGKNMLSRRGAAAGVEVDGKIHLIGGTTSIGSGKALNLHEVYDPVSDNWTSAPPLPLVSEHVSAVLFNGKIHVIGGRSDFVNLNALQIFNPQTRNWSQGPSLQNARSGFAAVVFEKRILVFGGESINPRNVIPTSERFDPKTGSWSFIENAPEAVHGVAGASFGRFVYLFGGSTTGGSPAGTIDKVQRLSISNRPKSPTGLKVNSITANSASLNWIDPSNNETAFDVQAKAGSQKYKNFSSLAANTKSTTLSGLLPNTPYSFRVRARNGCGTSGFSNVTQATTRP